MADVAQRRAGLHHLDAAHHGFVGHLDQAAGDDLRLADEEHAAGVAVPTVDDDGDVDVDDVAVVETLVVAGNAVADDVVHRGADRLGEAAIVQWRSEEHTSELPSLMRISYAVFCLKTKKTNRYYRFSNIFYTT